MRDCKLDWGTKSTEQQPRGEKKRQLDGFPVESVFSNILCCQQPEMVLGVAVQKDGQILQ